MQEGARVEVDQHPCRRHRRTKEPAPLKLRPQASSLAPHALTALVRAIDSLKRTKHVCGPCPWRAHRLRALRSSVHTLTDAIWRASWVGEIAVKSGGVQSQRGGQGGDHGDLARSVQVLILALGGINWARGSGRECDEGCRGRSEAVWGRPADAARPYVPVQAGRASPAWGPSQQVGPSCQASNASLTRSAQQEAQCTAMIQSLSWRARVDSRQC